MPSALASLMGVVRMSDLGTEALRLCRGCALVSPPEELERHAGICTECWNRRESWAGGGPLRVVTSGDTYHETPRCPGAKGAEWWAYWTDESCMYADLAGELDKCVRCHAHHTFGFDEYIDDPDRQVVIGHA